MPMPTRFTAFDANTANRQSVAQWLQTGLNSYFKDGIGRWAFRPLESHIGRQDDLAEDLRTIYNSLPADAQTRWRLAIRDLLAMHGPDISKREAVRVLIDFATLVRAHEVLEVLPALVANGRDELMFDHVVRTATALASQTEASRDCLQRICTSPKFAPDYAGLILMALCHADPNNWLTHVENLAAPMKILADRLSDGSTALRFYASTILEAISLSRITGAAANRLSRHAESQWLWSEWFEGDQSLIRHEPKTDASARLSLRVNDAVSATIDECPATHENASAIAWVKAPKSRFWTAICQEGHLAELSLKSYQDCIAAQRFFLAEHGYDIGHDLESPFVVAPWLAPNQYQVEAETDMPDLAGILIRSPEGSTVPIIECNPTSLWDGPVRNKYTYRVQYLKEHRGNDISQYYIEAFRDRHAFSAAARAIGLAKENGLAA